MYVPEASYQYPATREGNSKVEWRGLTKYDGTRENWGPYNLYCHECKKPVQDNCLCDQVCEKTQNSVCNKDNCVKDTDGAPTSFSKYYYVQ